MTAKANSTADGSTHLAPVILFGIDSSGKPKAGRFGKNHAGLAFKAASQLQLHVLPGNDPKLAAIAGRVPVGRVHATGRMFVPFVRRDLYEMLLAAATNSDSQQQTAAPPSGASGHAGGGKPPGSPPNLPRTWSEIGIGDLVIAFESSDEGWYEAIVAEADGDMLTLRWRDYPRERRITRHRNRLGLLQPTTGPAAAPPKKPTATAKQAASASGHSATSKPLPMIWADIDVGHLVLAKTDAPWGTWWEAVVMSNAGDELTLRWRDNHANVPAVKRLRSDLALIRPEVA
jgi:hypothetical protein